MVEIKEHSMFTLAQYNQQVQACQDEAYTLAWYLLADEAAAEAVVQEAVEMVFRQTAGGQRSCRQAIFCAVLRQCHLRWRSSMPITGAAAGQAVHTLLHRLPEVERQVLVLVEIIGLGYHETAQLVHRPVKEIQAVVAQARRLAAE
jgi:DNA-directed RNA polymerase specialized sigma24 family protein